MFQRVLFDSKGWCIGTPYHPFSTLWKIQVYILHISIIHIWKQYMSNIHKCITSHNHQQNQTTNFFGYVIAPLRKVSNNSAVIFTVGIPEKYGQNLPQANTCLPMTKHHQLKRLKMNFYLRRWCLFGNNSSLSSICYLWIRYACLNQSISRSSFFVAGFWAVRKTFDKKNIVVGNVSKHLLLR